MTKLPSDENAELQESFHCNDLGTRKSLDMRDEVRVMSVTAATQQTQRPGQYGSTEVDSNDIARS